MRVTPKLRHWYYVHVLFQFLLCQRRLQWHNRALEGVTGDKWTLPILKNRQPTRTPKFWHPHSQKSDSDTAKINPTGAFDMAPLISWEAIVFYWWNFLECINQSPNKHRKNGGFPSSSTTTCIVCMLRSQSRQQPKNVDKYETVLWALLWLWIRMISVLLWDNKRANCHPSNTETYQCYSDYFGCAQLGRGLQQGYILWTFVAVTVSLLSVGLALA